MLIHVTPRDVQRYRFGIGSDRVERARYGSDSTSQYITTMGPTRTRSFRDPFRSDPFLDPFDPFWPDPFFDPFRSDPFFVTTFLNFRVD